MAKKRPPRRFRSGKHAMIMSNRVAAHLPAAPWTSTSKCPTLGNFTYPWVGPVAATPDGTFLQIPADLPPADRDRLFQFYASWQQPGELVSKYRDLMEGIASLKFVAGCCYTQLTDIEQETTGLLFYDRRPKVDPALISAVNISLFGNLPPDISRQKRP